MRIRITRFYTQQTYKQGPNKEQELIKRPLERTEIELDNILRWEDDGGKIKENIVRENTLHGTQT